MVRAAGRDHALEPPQKIGRLQRRSRAGWPVNHTPSRRPRRATPAHSSAAALKNCGLSDVSALIPSPGTTRKQWFARGLKIWVSWWHAAAAMAIRAVSTTYRRAAAEMVSIFRSSSSVSAPFSFISKERRHLVHHDLRDGRTRRPSTVSHEKTL